MKDRRNYPRFKILADLTVQVKKKKINVMGYDFSRGGMGFVTPEVIPLNAKAVISSKKYSLQREGVIQSKSAIDQYPNMFKYGMQFLVPMSLEEVEMIVARMGRQ